MAYWIERRFIANRELVHAGMRQKCGEQLYAYLLGMSRHPLVRESGTYLDPYELRFLKGTPMTLQDLVAEGLAREGETDALEPDALYARLEGLLGRIVALDHESVMIGFGELPACLVGVPKRREREPYFVRQPYLWYQN